MPYLCKLEGGRYAETIEVADPGEAVTQIREKPRDEIWIISKFHPSRKLARETRIDCRMNAGLKSLVMKHCKKLEISLADYLESLIVDDLT